MQVVDIAHLQEAYIWTGNGSHPDDGEDVFTDGEFKGEKYEGKVVRYFRHPEIPGITICKECGESMHEHGWIDQGTTGQTVCKGDYVITVNPGIYVRVKPTVFKQQYRIISGSGEING